MNGRPAALAAVVGLLVLGIVVGLWFARPADPAPEVPVPAPAVTTTQSSATSPPPTRRTPPRPATPRPRTTEPEDDEAPTPEAEMRRPDPQSEPLTALAAEEPDMRDMEGGAAEYDARVEAKQRFRDFELTAIAARPLTPETWRKIQADRGDETLEVLKRAKELTDEGEPEAARELMEEWQRLTSLYRNEAYDRGEVLVSE